MTNKLRSILIHLLGIIGALIAYPVIIAGIILAATLVAPLVAIYFVILVCVIIIDFFEE